MENHKFYKKTEINKESDICEENENSIRFISKSKEYFEFSNFYERNFVLNDVEYKTIEHYFQSQKFINNDTEYAHSIINAKTPSSAKALGRKNSTKLRDDWNSARMDIMYEGLKAKFTQNKDLKELLLSTENRIIIEDNKRDNFWGIGKNEKGQNNLGVLLMKLRDEFKN